MLRGGVWSTGLGALWLLVAVSDARAVITRLTPLSDVLKESQYISVAQVEKLLPEKPAMVLTVSEDLKGKLPFRRLPVNLTGDAEAKRKDHTAQLLKRLAPDLSIVLFGSQRGKRVTLFAYSNGTWFQLVGTAVEGQDSLVVGFTHCEPFLRRTYKGPTKDLVRIIKEGLAGKKEPPPPSPKEEPGLGPEIAPEKKPDRGASLPVIPVAAGPLFAVIPTIGIGGPLAVLAVLFPTLFGGVLVLFRRWAAFFTVVSTVSTLYLLHRWYAIRIASSWWSTQAALWLVLTLITLLGVLWSWRRHVTLLQQEGSGEEKARRTEHVILWLLSLACLASLAFWRLDTVTSFSDPAGALLLAFSAAVWLGTLYKLYRDVAARRWSSAPALSTEGVMLWTAAVALILIPSARMATLPAIASETEIRLWSHVFQDHGGLIVSSPCVDGDHIYVSVAHRQGFDTFGTVYCLDARTHEVVWRSTGDLDMKQVFSSPTVVDGRLYVGEGFHDDLDCKVYCLDAKTGRRLWEHQTSSQTESSPVVADGKVFIGAGNEGVLALEAGPEKKVCWRYPASPSQDRRWRVGAPVAVAGGRVYAGSGVDRRNPEDPGETSLVCLESATGKEVWKVAANLPIWAAPVVAGDQVFVSLGNGDVFTDVEKPGKPAGAILCLDASTGQQRWRADVPNGVLGKVAVDDQHVYFGARDGQARAVHRGSGSLAWSVPLGSPIIAAPVLHTTTPGKPIGVFFVSTAGRVCCLSPGTGKSHWTYHALEEPGMHVSSSPVLQTTAAPEGHRRRLYFGASRNTLTIPVLYCLEDLLAEPVAAAQPR